MSPTEIVMGSAEPVRFGERNRPPNCKLSVPVANSAPRVGHPRSGIAAQRMS
jgi:hypothetical protein